MEALTIHKSNLSADQIALLIKLVEEHSDVFVLDTTVLGSTNLAAHYQRSSPHTSPSETCAICSIYQNGRVCTEDAGPRCNPTF